MEADFSGYATKSGLRCSDGRTIMPDAFAKQDGSKVPLVWQHGHSDPSNVLGHALLENRRDGVYAYGFFNNSESAETAKGLVQHGDITAMSIYANQLVEKSKNVMHGSIREVSLVLSGANPGALIDNVNIRHSDGDVECLDDEAVIYTGLELEHSDNAKSDNNNSTSQENSNMPNNSEKTVQDVFDSMTEEQKNVVYFMVGTALEEAEDSDDDLKQYDGAPFITHQEAFEMSRNIFEMAQGDNNGSIQHSDNTPTLSHSDIQEIIVDAKRGGSFKEAFLEHAAEYGIENIDYLFPDAKTITSTPEYIQRRTEWVTKVLNGVKKSPFSRVKTVVADITAEEARARGYVKGNLKKEEVFKLLRRKTEPTTIYKKQKLDRDDMIDITDLDVVAWIKGEMRLMLDEEIARAILIGDGRSEISEDKIDETRIRPIASDDDMYSHKVDITPGSSPEDTIEAMIRARAAYRGNGQPVLFTTLPFLTDMLLLKDKMGRRLYSSKEALATELLAKEIVEVEVMENTDVKAIYVNLPDYTAGADKGGEISMFDDFDIDYNQHKYLIETRMSGALTKPKSAVVIREVLSEIENLSDPSFNGAEKKVVLSAPTKDLPYYFTINGEKVDESKTQIPFPDVQNGTIDVEAVAKPGHKFAPNTQTVWVYAVNTNG